MDWLFEFLKSQAAAAWVQAIGSILALVGAILIPLVQSSRRARASALTARIMVQEAFRLCDRIDESASINKTIDGIFPPSTRSDLYVLAAQFLRFNLENLPSPTVTLFHYVRTRIINLENICAEVEDAEGELSPHDRARIVAFARQVAGVKDKLLRLFKLGPSERARLDKEYDVQQERAFKDISESDELYDELRRLFSQLEKDGSANREGDAPESAQRATRASNRRRKRRPSLLLREM